MNCDNISAAMIYMLWHEEHLWNVGILQRVDISNLVGIAVCSPLESMIVE
jgi:hypothetical protein